MTYDICYDVPSCYWETRPRARKPHKCCECGTRIEPGEDYHRIAGVWDGEFGCFKSCAACETLRGLLHAEGVDVYYGGLYEAIEESDVLPAMLVLGTQAGS